jgi:hypothetical protein
MIGMGVAEQPIRQQGANQHLASTAFGSAAAFPLSPVTRMFHFFQTQYEPGFILTSKVVGNAVPRVAITRTWDERKEVAFNEVTHTAGLFAVLPLASRLFDPIQSWISGVPTQLIRMRNEEAFAKVSGEALQQLKMAKLGKSLGVSSLLAFLMLLMPYWRNYRTIEKTGFSDYKKVVALGGKQTPTGQDLQEAAEANRKNRRLIQLFLGLGAASGLAMMGAAGLIARRGRTMLSSGLFRPERLNKLLKDWGFVGKNSDQFYSIEKSAKQTFWVWGVPSYIGWFAGCRDGYELMEQGMKFLTFVLGYVATPKIFKSLMEFKDRALLKEFKDTTGKIALPSYDTVINKLSKTDPAKARVLLKHMDTRRGVSLIGNLFVIGVLPLLFNIWFSAWRYKRENADSTGSSAPPLSTPTATPLQRKSFEAWMAHDR